MFKLSKLIVLFALVLSGALAAHASLPRYIINFKNTEFERRQLRQINRKWEFYLKDNSEILYNKPTHKYKNDQFCSFEFDIDEEGKLIPESIHLAKHKKNYAFNLKALKYLQNLQLNFKKEKAKEKIQADLAYYAF
ncbi:MAG: hypothetical protein MK033_02790 [Candidatus Caenarcaniphilales bacterium]|nr:hypothetical protein [Candidatus Caenarcaniphilales bacterium]